VILLVLNIQNTVFTVLGTVFIYISLVLTVVSLIDYIAKNKEVLKDQN
jgi:CDP-diacylglycerol--glycerol-3-phosphate 3-phosphatidyltransferase